MGQPEIFLAALLAKVSISIRLWNRFTDVSNFTMIFWVKWEIRFRSVWGDGDVAGLERI